MILLIVLTANFFGMNANALTAGTILERKHSTDAAPGAKIKSMSLKNWLLAKDEFKKTSTERFTPKFSMSLLKENGIHLFSISKMGPLPSMNIGTRINAGIKITL